MATRTKNPVSGFPRTWQFTDTDGNPVYRIKPRIYTPIRAKIRDNCLKGVAWIMALTCLFVILDSNNVDGAFVGVLAIQAGQALAIFAMLIFYTALRTERVVMSADVIAVRRWWGWKRFERNEPHMFYVTIHDWAVREHERIAEKVHEAAQKGKKLRIKAYFGQSFHIVLSYGGQRHDLMTVYGAKEADAVLGRLQYCDFRLDEAMSGRGGSSGQQSGGSGYAPGGL